MKREQYGKALLLKVDQCLNDITIKFAEKVDTLKKDLAKCSQLYDRKKNNLNKEAANDLQDINLRSKIERQFRQNVKQDIDV